MNEENFKEGIEGLKNIRMTDAEKTRMLERVFSAPIKSPYLKRSPIFIFFSAKNTRVVLTSCLVLVLSIGGTTYASGSALPGDLLYPIKINIIESVLDVINSAPERKMVWGEKKVIQRILEAETLAEKGELDDDKLEELERTVEKSSRAFAEAASIVASSTATSTFSARKKVEDLKQEFRERINERREKINREGENREKQREIDKVKVEFKQKIEDRQNTDTGKGLSDKDRKHGNQREKIRKLENVVIRVLDDDNKDKEEND